MAASRPHTPGSNSGAFFLQDDFYFHKFGHGSLGTRVKSQALWLSRLTESQARGHPQLAFVYWSCNEVFHTTELIRAATAADLFLSGDHVKQDMVIDIFVDVIHWTRHVLHRPSLRMPSGAARQVVQQVLKRVKDEYRLPASMAEFLFANEVNIGEKCVLGAIKSISKAITIIESGVFDNTALSTIHGDIHLGNILTDLSKWWLIDPRGSFGEGVVRFDPYYEWAKILHDCHGLYGLICAGKIVAVKEGQRHARFNYSAQDILAHERLLSRTLAALDSVASAYGEERIYRRKLLLYEGLILLGIVPFHQHDVQRAFTLACVGLLMLDLAFNDDIDNISLKWLE